MIPRLDIKGPNLVKGIHLEGLRVLGDPHEFARRYYEQGADELLYIDIVASLYGRSNLIDVVERTARDIFIPITVGGGVRSVSDMRALLKAGADKVALNTAATRDPTVITQGAHAFGSQCIVVSIEAKRQPDGTWEAFTDNGRERSGRDAVTWAFEAVERGAGEILVTSVDREGTRKGFDVELVAAIAPKVNVPVIAGGGGGSAADVVEVVRAGGADAVAIASILHYGTETVASLKEKMTQMGVRINHLVTS